VVDMFEWAVKQTFPTGPLKWVDEDDGVRQ
jgi:hypothetical protein